MPRWAMFLVVAPLTLCLGCGALGYLVVWPKVETAALEVEVAVTDEMADAVARSVSHRIRASARTSAGPAARNELILRAADLNVNNTESIELVGIEYSSAGTRVFGIETRIDPAGISLWMHNLAFSGVPEVENGRLELTQIEAGEAAIPVLLTVEAFEDAIETGIDRALRDHGLTPVSLTLRPGTMTVRVEPVACLGDPGRIGGCGAATPSALVAG